MRESNHTNYNQENKNDYSSLPPRNSIHKKKEERNRKSNKSRWNFTQITLVLFLILLVASPIYFYYQYQGDDNGTGTILAQNIEVEEADGLQENQEAIDESEDNELTDDNNHKKDQGITKADNENIENNDNQSDNQIDEMDKKVADQQNEIESNENINTLVRTHVVKAGENLFRISLQYYSSGKYVEALAKYNQLNNPNDIYAGLSLKIPNKDKLLIQ